MITSMSKIFIEFDVKVGYGKLSGQIAFIS